MLTKEHFIKAADTLETEGWCQNSYKNHEGCRCVIGALRYAALNDYEQTILGTQFSENESYEELGKTFVQFMFGDQDKTLAHVEVWNDHRSRTKEEVVAKLRAFVASLPDESPV